MIPLIPYLQSPKSWPHASARCNVVAMPKMNAILSVSCPHCKACARAPCTTPTGMPLYEGRSPKLKRSFHVARAKRAYAVLALHHAALTTGSGLVKAAAFARRLVFHHPQVESLVVDGQCEIIHVAFGTTKRR